MGKRKISILSPAADAIAGIAFFIENQGLPATAKKFVDESFSFFESLSNDIIEYKFCTYERWKALGYRCVNYKKKYVVAYISLSDEIIICDFVPSKLLKE